MYTIFYLINLKGINHLVYIGVDRWIILKWSLKNRVSGCGLYLCGLEPVGSCEYGNGNFVL
jgi:hypothetical protein